MINMRLYRVLLIASIWAVAAIMPYVFHIQASTLSEIPLSLPILITISIVQSAVLFSIVLFAGLFLAKKVHLGAPYIEQWIDKKTFPFSKYQLIQLVSYGIVVATTIIIADFLFQQIGITLQSATIPPLWQGLLASFYGGIGEEILLRLFLMTSLVWIGSVVFRINHPNKSSVLMWATIIISSVLFGIGHLPATAAISELTTGLVLRAIVLNGIGGVVFGWLYWKRGLLSAMIAHFSADIMLHVIFASILLF
jgi:membrane protease YdiL (CAAX protease family)